ncbi:hypothetical protein EDD69_101238 [Thermolongibacillus altinsuensis]|uniref:Uncharacterized protein n=1 Tax=Thermolongibacillus altinsuensis TaxID=575256 RepID=A0A4R1QT15_9BACL|nr:hypothetical protein [Thermolongibacillus altinsuensis]TCL53230.1 hypothetical protein EDD69_101238 [Thermolongibacillus altinsuensis]
MRKTNETPKPSSNKIRAIIEKYEKQGINISACKPRATMKWFRGHKGCLFSDL